MDGLGRHSRDKYAEIHKILREIWEGERGAVARHTEEKQTKKRVSLVGLERVGRHT
jgi:hypothetical protein